MELIQHTVSNGAAPNFPLMGKIDARYSSTVHGSGTKFDKRGARAPRVNDGDGGDTVRGVLAVTVLETLCRCLWVTILAWR